VSIILSLLWNWRIDRKMSDRFDLLGAAICLMRPTLDS
jgi:drug/metabolite transporter superfamily protein YnfA